jgi:phage-related protein
MLKLNSKILPDADAVQTYTDDTSSVKFGGGYQQDSANSPKFQREVWDLNYTLLNQEEYDKLMATLMKASTIETLLWMTTGQTANFLRFSNLLSNGAWVKSSGVTVTEVSAGTLHNKAWTTAVVPAGLQKVLEQTISYPSASDWCFSAYFLATADTIVTLELNLATGYARFTLNVFTGAVISSDYSDVDNVRFGVSVDTEGFYRIYISAEGLIENNTIKATVKFNTAANSTMKIADLQVNPGSTPSRLARTTNLPSFKKYKRSKEGKLVQTRSGETYNLKFQLVEVA